MEKLSNIAFPIRRDAVRLLSDGSMSAATETYQCEKCKDAGYLRRDDISPTDPSFGQAIVCSCKVQEIHTKRLAELIELSNLGRYKTCTFANFVTPETNPNLTDAYVEALEFADQAKGFLILSGGCGVGKTHLAAAIVNSVRFERGMQAIFTVVPDLLDHIRSTYKNQQGQQNQNEGSGDYDEEFEKVKTCSLLVLDDLGSERTTKWTVETLYQLINYRYNHELATVVTTNKDLSSFDDRIKSRFLDEVVCEIKAPDYRQSQERREQKRNLRLVK